ncbi:MAG TPA: hypothetical protein QGH67_04855 [Alphaproteobacteria bacterium]|jgi:hypothetical protein|nr:hypothetical protein [Candidatus Paceibacterota bacterium]HJO14101.1 hypothetical protein [Alphaproteobacteria bacterium]|tara:strand:+ start:4206 stop:4532 length:327 start_codon:yes stop_codon:yes gene_type:complete
MINKTVKQKLDKLVTELPSYEELDKEHVVAWHPVIGYLIEEWQDKLIEYCTDRDRPYFFAMNNWGMPVCIFDSTTQKEWDQKMTKERSKQKKQYFPYPRKEIPYEKKK